MRTLEILPEADAGVACLEAAVEAQRSIMTRSIFWSRTVTYRLYNSSGFHAGVMSRFNIQHFYVFEFLRQ